MNVMRHWYSSLAYRDKSLVVAGIFTAISFLVLLFLPSIILFVPVASMAVAFVLIAIFAFERPLKKHQRVIATIELLCLSLMVLFLVCIAIFASVRSH